MSYTLSAGVNSFWGVDKTISEYVNGWPFRYNITNLSGNGTVVTAAVAASPIMHFLSGDKITVEAVPLKKVITSINSNGTLWTIASTAHGFTPGQSIVHENITNATYNGSYTVNTVPDANTYTILSVVNPGASSGGTARLATPGTYFSGEYQVISATATTVSYTCAATTPAPDIATSILTSPDRCKFYSMNPSVQIPYGGSYTYVALFVPNQISAVPLPTNQSQGPLYLGGTPTYTNSIASYTPQVQISLGINAIPTAGGSSGDPTATGFRRIKRWSSHRYINTNFVSSSVADFCAFIDMETPQPKHQGYTLAINPPTLPYNVFSETPDYASA
jgi:hypothetical protein